MVREHELNIEAINASLLLVLLVFEEVDWVFIITVDDAALWILEYWKGRVWMWNLVFSRENWWFDGLDNIRLHRDNLIWERHAFWKLSLHIVDEILQWTDVFGFSEIKAYSNWRLQLIHRSRSVVWAVEIFLLFLLTHKVWVKVQEPSGLILFFVNTNEKVGFISHSTHHPSEEVFLHQLHNCTSSLLR